MNERLLFLREKTQNLTASPGVYRMRDSDGGIIYIGKAKNLKNRVSSYFRENPDHTPKTARMVRYIYDYDFIVTDTEYEALVLECSLIKQHKPKYNILLKDDKGNHYIKISNGEYPVITTESSKQEGEGTFLGPFTGSFATKQAVNEANRIFMLPTCKKKFPPDIGKERPCLNFHIKQCVGVCAGGVSAEEYRRTAEQAAEYIKSGAASSIESLTCSMEKAAEELDFERAARIRDRIAAIGRATGEQKMVSQALCDTDIIALSQNGEFACVAVIMYRNGRLFDKGEYFLGVLDSPEKILADFIIQYYSTAEIPREIIVEEELPDREIIEKLLRERCGHAVTLDTRKRGKGLKLILLAKSNASEYLALRVGRTGREITALEELGKLLGLPAPPLYIEAYDISNLGSSSMVAGMVVFENGRPLKKAYKRFSIKETAIQNDVACMREVLRRRFNHLNDDNSGEGFSRMPDLILLDGGKGQVNAVQAALTELSVNVPLFGMVKDGKHRTRAITTGGHETAFASNKSAFALVTRIQDEVHRFALSYHHSKHKSRSYSMEITKAKGIGEKKAQKLFAAFKTREEFKKASQEDIAKIAGVNMETARQVYEIVRGL
ncbi:MAG: excinuclease ABC subunit UvrC [Oscillospiraceae bacterium]|nr:excinuclease ABC subunit UvrC [Oscillospiraceae bacterium]